MLADKYQSTSEDGGWNSVSQGLKVFPIVGEYSGTASHVCTGINTVACRWSASLPFGYGELVTPRLACQT